MIAELAIVIDDDNAIYLERKICIFLQFQRRSRCLCCQRE